MQALLQPLADERLITTGRDAVSGAETVEVSHEALIRAWPTFGRWINESREALRLRLQLEEAVKEWLASGGNEDFLWHSNGLEPRRPTSSHRLPHASGI